VSVQGVTLRLMEVLVALIGLLVGALVTWLVVRSRYAVQLATVGAERALLRERVVDLEAALSEDSETAQMIAPLRSSLDRVERQVHDLERERVAQFSQVAAEMARVARTTTELGAQTASLVGSLNASSVRGSWGEVQLRRVLEHAGMLARCDFEEQVTATGADDRRLRPDVVVRLPGGKSLVVDAKTPMSAFLAAQREGLSAAERSGRLAAHAKALRGHIDALAGKAYWSAFDATPEMVVCFVPGDAILTAALAQDPELHEYAMRRRVVLASPATLLALLRTVAFTWQQDALADNARELLTVGRDLYDRLGSLGAHAQTMGAALRRSVEAYNGFVGSLEHRVLPTARRMRDLGLVDRDLERLPPLDATPRPLTAYELVDRRVREGGPDEPSHTPDVDLATLEPDVGRPQLDVAPDGDPSSGARSA
jgi:DNA recombination protein RmuC